MEKQKTTVRVAGKDYALVSTDSPEHLNRVAAYVDRQMTETMRSGRIPANTAAVLTALNLADDLMRAQDEVNRFLRARQGGFAIAPLTPSQRSLL